MTLAALPSLVSNIACAAAYVVLGALILGQARRSLTGFWLAAAAFATAAWAIAGALAVSPQVAGAFDLVRLLGWYGFSLHLYRRAMDRSDRLFTAIGGVGALCALAIVLSGHAGLNGVVSLTTPAIMLHLGLAISQLLLLENIYRGSPADQRWHVGLACCTLGVLAAYEAVVAADAALLRVASPVLLGGRPLVSILVAPLLALAAARNRHWRVDIHVSRTAAFHSATLVVSGVFLMALAAVGELARQFGSFLGADWGGLAEIYLVCAGVLTMAILLTSGSARSALRRGLVDHFFTHRYDYRREWQNCIKILSATGPLPERLIQALAAVVDSPSGLLFAHEPGQSGMAWAGAWKTPPRGPLSEPDARIMTAGGPFLLRVESLSPAWRAEHDGSSFEPWLAVPLFRPGGGEPQVREAMGCILLARSRTAFQLDAEVFDLLRILAHEVSIHLAQHQAATSLLQTRDLRAYGERFAFVAHDIKNVSSQLSLLLANAETHLADPAFQRDMLATVRASVARISGLIRRLEPAREADAAHVGQIAPSRLDVAARLTALLAARPGPGQPRPELDGGHGAAAGADGRIMVTMDASAFDAAVTHLLDNAAVAAGPAGEVRVLLRATAGRAIIEIIDNGIGMTPEFIRDELFRPFATRTEGGSGLGAFQARALVRAAGGDLAVQSTPGRGTTMRLLLPRAVAEASAGAMLAPMDA